MGFRFNLDAAWHPLDPSSVPHDPEAIAKDPRFSRVNPQAFLAALQKVESGQYEFYFRDPVGGFAENIAIQRGNVQVPSDAKEVSARCDALSGMLGPKYGRKVGPARCDVRKVDGRVANYIEVDGPIAGTTNLQCQIQATADQAVMILATVWQGHIDAARAEFDALLKSVRFEPPSSAGGGQARPK